MIQAKRNPLDCAGRGNLMTGLLEGSTERAEHRDASGISGDEGDCGMQGVGVNVVWLTKPTFKRSLLQDEATPGVDLCVSFLGL